MAASEGDVPAPPASPPRDKMRLSATVVVASDHEVLSISDSYYGIYGIEPGAPLRTAAELLQSRVKAGWFAISEAFAACDNVAFAIERVNKNPYYRDFHISPTGAVVDVTHCKDPETGLVTLDFIPTGVVVETAPGQGVERRALLALRDLGEMRMFGTFPMSHGSDVPPGDKSASLLAAPRTGAILITDAAGHFPELAGIDRIDDLPLDFRRLVRVLNQRGQYDGSAMLRADRKITLSLNQHHLYDGGPAIITGRIGMGAGQITSADIRRKIPGLTEKEAEILILLAQGKTLKEAAAITGKAQVTATLQARSGLLKSGARSMNALLARINRLTPKG